jgi:predicted transcriptional regulator
MMFTTDWIGKPSNASVTIVNMFAPNCQRKTFMKSEAACQQIKYWAAADSRGRSKRRSVENWGNSGGAAHGVLPVTGLIKTKSIRPLFLRETHSINRFTCEVGQMERLKIEIQDLESVKNEMKNAFKRAERGEIQETEISVSFESFETLLKVLTPKRFELLKLLKRLDKANVAQLSRASHRNYKNVSTDLKVLNEAGLVDRDDGSYVVPYNVIESEFRVN